MTLRFIKYSCLISALFIPAFAYAQNVSDEIPCSSVTIINQTSQKIDTALKVNDNYLAYTSTPAFQANNLWWFVGVGGISAETSDDAITKAKEMIRNANSQEDVYATKQGNEFICKYGPDHIEARGKNLSA